MAAKKLTDPSIGSLSSIADDDLFMVVDVSDTTQDPTGSTKKVTRPTVINGLLKSVDNLSDLGDAASARNNLGLGSAAVVDMTAFDAAGLAAIVQSNLNTHTANTSNPHEVTASQVLPDQAGNTGKYLSTDGTSVSWTAAPSGGGSPGGSDGQVQYNDAGAFAGSDFLTVDPTAKTLRAGGTTGTYSGSFDRAFIVDATGCTTAPCVFGFAGTSGNTNFRARFDFDGGFSGVQCGTQLSPQIYGWSGIAIRGARGAAAPAFENLDGVGSPSLTVFAGEISGHGIGVRAKDGIPGNAYSVQDSIGNDLAYLRSDGSFKPAALADAAAVDDSVFYSTDQSKLCYKDPAGTVNPLY